MAYLVMVESQYYAIKKAFSHCTMTLSHWTSSEGLKSLQNRSKPKGLAQPADRESITSSVEHWLDNDVILVDVEQFLETLEKAFDCERSVARQMSFETG
jgi:hypothetical protein